MHWLAGPIPSASGRPQDDCPTRLSRAIRTDPCKGGLMPVGPVDAIVDASSAGHASAPHAAMQAVVVIHGMGEQRPMDPIKAFVRALWETDAVITANGLPHPSQVWNKPDLRTCSLELRPITTHEIIAISQFPVGVRTDFYELYSAYLTAGSAYAPFIVTGL